MFFYNVCSNPHTPARMAIQVVIDTNVFVAALRSTTGAAHVLFNQIGSTTKWELNLSPALFLEYEEQAKRIAAEVNLSFQDIDKLLERIATESNKWLISDPREPRSRDPDDDFVLDLAIGAGVQYIITFNTGNFAGAGPRGIRVIRPGDFLPLAS